MNSTKSNRKRFKPKFIKQVQTSKLHLCHLHYKPDQLRIMNRDLYISSSANYNKIILRHYYYILQIIINGMD